MTIADTIPATGQVLADRYRIDRVLGRGGMGVVLGAHHLHLDERVAIKFLLPELAHDEGLVARFLREGRAAIKIRSEHVVRVLDVATMPGGTPFMVMEYLDGADLAGVLASQGPLPLTAVVDYLLQAIEAIAEAHALGMVHRDLKPSNLFLVRRPDGTPCVKVLDFGITKVAGHSGQDMGMTKTNAVMGSPRYMSPEQMRSTRAVDARADVWALGIVVYELLCGATPFDAETMPELLAKILQDAPPPMALQRPDIPPDVQQAVARCLEKDPGARFGDVAQLAHALAPYGSAGARASAELAARVLSLSGGGPSPGQGVAPASARQAPGPAPPPTTPTASAWSGAGRTSRSPAVAMFAIGGLLLVGLALGVLALLVRSGRPPSAATSISPTTTTFALPSATALPTATLAPPPAPSVAAGGSSAARSPEPSATPSPASRTRPATQPHSAPAPSPGNELFDGRR